MQSAPERIFKADTRLAPTDHDRVFCDQRFLHGSSSRTHYTAGPRADLLFRTYLWPDGTRREWNFPLRLGNQFHAVRAMGDPISIEPQHEEAEGRRQIAVLPTTIDR